MEYANTMRPPVLEFLDKDPKPMPMYPNFILRFSTILSPGNSNYMGARIASVWVVCIIFQ